MQSVPAAIACLLLAGFAQSLTMISVAVILMRTASEHFRGRVMGAHARDLQPADRPPGSWQPDRRDRLRRNRNLYAASGLALMLLHWRADLWYVHAPANAK